MKTVLTIAGSDSSGGAGIQADLKTFEFFKCFGMSVITILTAQNTKGVSDIYTVSPEFVESQLNAIREDFSLSAIKIGMLYSTKIIETIELCLDRNEHLCPVVLDPVAVSNAGSKLLDDDAIEALSDLFPIVDLVTPNLTEFKLFMGLDSTPGLMYMETHRQEIADRFKSPVLVKTFIEKSLSIDVLVTDTGVEYFESPYIENAHTHGSGCTLSSAIAANLAHGMDLKHAIQRSKEYLCSAISLAPGLGGGSGPLLHNLNDEDSRCSLGDMTVASPS